MPTEGQTATGPNGERAVFRNGQWVVVSAQQPPADPEYPYKGAQAQESLRGSQLDNQGQAVDNAVTQGTARTTIQTNQAPTGTMWIDPNDPRKGVMPIPGYDPNGASVDKNKLAQFRALEAQIARVEELYKEGPGKTSGVMGFADYLPTDSNARFDSASAGLGEIGRAAFRVPGSGDQSASELEQFIKANTPSASDKDGAIEEKLRNLRTRLQETYRELGVDPSGSGEGERLNALTYLRTDGGANNDKLEAAGFGATKEAVPYPAEGQAEHDALVASLIASNGGRLDPAAYARARSQLDKKYGMAGDAASYEEWAGGINEYLDNGGVTIPTGISAGERDMELGEIIGNSLVDNPIGALGAGYFDAATLGAASTLAGREKFNALQEKRPISTIGGQIVGAMSGTGAIGYAGRKAAERVAPRLLGGEGKAQFGRNLATDVAYGTGYGTIAEGDPILGAVSGGVGSAIGQPLGSAFGRTIGGIDYEKAAQALRGRGIPLTTGQMAGGTAKAIEDRMTSTPVIGDLLKNRRMEGLEAFNREAMREAGAPIGFNPSQIGRGGVEDMQQAVGRAYDDATAGANVQFDDQFRTDFAQFGDAAQRLPRDLRVKAARAAENRIVPLTDAGSMTGPQYQQAIRGLKGYKAETSKPGFEMDYRDTLTLAQDALTSQMRRGGGDEVVQRLADADAAYKGIKTVEDAAFRADGADYLFTPSQLQDATKRTARKFPGKNGLSELADEGQSVLPSRIPDSGTAGRAAQMVLPGAALGGGAGVGYAVDGQEGAVAGGTASGIGAALLALAATKNGQRALNKALFDRPEKAKKVGRAIRDKKRLFGAAGVPVVYSTN